jgi:uncharacterized protein YodC (DUF2158 family)
LRAAIGSKPLEDKIKAAALRRFGLDGPIEVGNVVRLNSGGPSMTVEEVLDDGQVKCVWFDKTRERTRTFNVTMLQKTTPEQHGLVVVGNLEGWDANDN